MSESLISFAIIAYNQEGFISDAIEASYAQDFHEMEVVISDDCSIDSTFEMIKHSVQAHEGIQTIVHHKAVNQGINANVNTIDTLCHGQFVVISAGDDVSVPNRVEKLVEQWEAGAVGVFSNAEVIDEQGNEKGLFMHKGYHHFSTWQEMIIVGSHGAWGATFAWDKKVFDLFGPLPLDILGEDAIIPFRCALLGGVAYVDEALVQYRDHGGNVSFWSQTKKASGKALRVIGSKTIQFDLLMYKYWRTDIRKAASSGFISAVDMEWAEERLCVHEHIRNAQLELLRVTFIQALLKCIKVLWSKRASDNRSLWFKRLIGTLLQFHMPLLYKMVIYIRGTNCG